MYKNRFKLCNKGAVQLRPHIRCGPTPPGKPNEGRRLFNRAFVDSLKSDFGIRARMWEADEIYNMVFTPSFEDERPKDTPVVVWTEEP